MVRRSPPEFHGEPRDCYPETNKNQGPAAGVPFANELADARRGETPGGSHDNLSTLADPFDDRTRDEAELALNFSGSGNPASSGGAGACLYFFTIESMSSLLRFTNSAGSSSCPPSASNA
jgi:hypothetical protein